MTDTTITITDEVAEAILRGAGYERTDKNLTITAQDGRDIADALRLLADLDEGDNTDTDELRRLATLVDTALWTDPETGYAYATNEQALRQALPALAEYLDMEPAPRQADLNDPEVRNQLEAAEIIAEAPVDGSRVEFTRTVERYPHFIVPAGATGVVTQADRDIYTVRLDEPVPGSEDWDGDVIWSIADGENPVGDIARDYVNRPAIKAMTDQELRDEIAAGGPAEADQAMREELGKREIAQQDARMAAMRETANAEAEIERARDEAEAYAEAHRTADSVFSDEWDANGTISVYLPATNWRPWLEARGWTFRPDGRWESPIGLTYWGLDEALQRQLLAEQIDTDQTGERS